jgi:hypothetical protein
MPEKGLFVSLTRERTWPCSSRCVSPCGGLIGFYQDQSEPAALELRP